MGHKESMPNQASLTDLPPELLDHIATYLPTANAIANLSCTSKSLHRFVEKDAWHTFSRTRFPSLCPSSHGASNKDVARTLTNLSRAWDRRAFVARYIEPQGDIRAFPGDKKLERWKRPRGQTIGFTPQLDCFEEIGSSWRERKEVLAFSAGAEVCVRTRRSHSGGSEDGDGSDVRWVTYRPLSASEGRDDVTSMHLLRPQESESSSDSIELITGTANGDLQLLHLSAEGETEIPKTSFATQTLPVRSSSLLQEQWKPAILAANMGDRRVCLYPVDSTQSNVAPSSQIDIRPPPNGYRSYRAWSTNFLSSKHLAVGLGPSEEPIHIYALTPSGLEKEAIRKFSLKQNLDKFDSLRKKPTSSVYPILPLPPSSTAAASSGDSQVFLSGAYDGIIRLHDLRSSREVEQAYNDPTDEGAIYSLLPRGQETLIAGTSRHSLLKVFDMRLGAKAYTYLDAGGNTSCTKTRGDWNLFLKANAATYSGRGGGNNWARRSAESSIYSLASPSPHSPYLYAGVENAVAEMAFTSVLDDDGAQDPAFFFRPTTAPGGKNRGDALFKTKEVMDLAMYEQDAPDMKLMTQRSLGETFRLRQATTTGVGAEEVLEGLDERWKVGS